MPSYKEVLKKAEVVLEAADRGEQEALILLLGLSELEAHNLYMEYENEIPEDLKNNYEKGVERLVKGEPLGHVLGFEWFYGYRFQVNEHVLIPRPETEELVGEILIAYDEMFLNQEQVVAVDIGTGSGAIAITLKKEQENIYVLATDISHEGIEVAKENAKQNEAHVEFLVGDMLQPLIERNRKVDLLISNPPYIPVHEELEEGVVGYEPHVALFGGEDGLKFYREIFQQAHLILKERAVLAFEIGYDQKDRILQLADEYFPKEEKIVRKDMSGKDRMLFIYKK